MDRITLLVADDHPMLREGLVAVLGTQPDFEVVGEAADGDEVVRLAESLNPDVILLDLEMPHTDGVEALEKFATRALARGRSSSRPTILTKGFWVPCVRAPEAICSRAPRGRRSSAPSVPCRQGARC